MYCLSETEQKMYCLPEAEQKMYCLSEAEQIYVRERNEEVKNGADRERRADSGDRDFL